MKVDEKTLEALKEFLENTEEFDGMVMRGCYGISINNVFSAFREYQRDKSKNVLTEHYAMTHMAYSLNLPFGFTLTEEDVIFYQKLLDGKTFWDISSFYDIEQIREMRETLRLNREHLEAMKLYEYRRKKASQFTGSKKNREFIFSRDGKVCKMCGATKNLALDHIIPVSHNGEDTYENLQVLCRSCNSKKSNKL